ncbi:MAG: LamG domain-containing protein [Candidatus Komeilibacteria bacterium]
MKKSTAYYTSIIFTAIIIVAGLVYLFQSYNVWAYLNPGADPIHYWSMDEMDDNTCPSGGDVCDQAGSYNGTAYYGAGWVGEDECVAGGCMYFDGVDDYVSFGDIPGVAGDLSVSFWIRPTDMTYRQNPLGKRYSDEFDFTLEIDDGLTYYHGETTTSGWYLGVATDPEFYLTSNEWQHIEVTRDVSARSGVYYANGKQIKTFTWSTSQDPTDGTLSFQFGKTYIADEYKGYLDEVKIYNYQRNAAQVLADYNAGIAGHTPKIGSAVALGSNNDADPGVPFAYWKMDDNSTANLTYDSGGGGYTGTPSNISWSPGKRGNAALFNSSTDKITLPNTWTSTSPFGSSNTDMSISMWIYPTVYDPDYSNHNVYNVMFANAGSVIDDNFEIGWYPDNVVFYMELNGTDYDYFVSSDISIGANDEWRYITLTKSSTDGVKVYVDGNLQGTVPGLTGAFNVNGTQGFDLMIGQTNNTGIYYQGYIDDLRIYDYAIDEKQILNDMYGAKGVHPILHYSFEEDYTSAAYDSTISALHGTIYGTPIKPQDGVLGSELYFDGSDDRILVGDWGYPAGWTDPFSISTWINVPSSETWTNGYKSAIMGRGSYSGSHGLLRNTTNNQVSMYVRADNGELYANGTITRDTWHHLVGTWNGTQVALYIDGVLASQTGTARSGAYDVSTWVINGPVSFGGNTGQYNEGGLDELKFYNYALSADDVKYDYNIGSAVALGADRTSSSTWADGGFGGDAPVHWFKLDENTGTTLYDSGTSSITGTTWDGSPAWYMRPEGPYLLFDGSTDGIWVDDINTWPNETLEAWVAIGPIETNGDIVGNAHTNSNNYGFTFFIDGNNLRAKAEQNNDTYFYTNVYTDISSYRTVWTHYAMTWDNLGTGAGGCDAEVKLYVNGQLVDSATHNVSSGTYDCTYPYPYPFSIGATTETSLTRQTNVLIDDIRVYDYVRTQAQIAFDMNGGKPTAHWSFDENTGTSAYDRYGGYTGTLSDGGVTWVDGKFGYALNFAGSSDTVNVEPLDTDYNIDGNANVTFAAWIYQTSQNTNRDIIGITTSGRDFVLKVGSTNYLNHHFHNGTYYNCTDSTSTISLNTWTHVAASMEDTGTNSTRVRLYKDGVLVNTCNHAADPDGVASTWVIGGLTTSAEQFVGRIDDVQFYTYVLSDDQVKKAMFANSSAYLE